MVRQYFRLGVGVCALLWSSAANAQNFTRTDYGDNGTNAAHAFVIDLNGDGKLDVVLGGHNQKIAVMLNQGGGVFSGPTVIGGAFFGLDAEAGDINGDGIPDLVSVDGFRMWTAIGNGTGGFTPGFNQILTQSGNPNRVHLADVNGDGILDVVAGDTQFAVIVALGNGNGTFQAPRRYGTTGQTYDIKLTDLNNDGFPDIVLAQASNGLVQLMLNDGAGNFSSSATYGEPFPRTVAVGDFNNDGKADVIIGSSPGSIPKIFVRFGNGDGTLGAETQLVTWFDAWSGAAGQISGNGNTDAVLAGEVLVNNHWVNSVLVLRGDGAGGFTNQGTFPVNNISDGVAIGQLNDDTLSDIVAPGGGAVSFLFRQPVPPIANAGPDRPIRRGER